MYGLIGKMGRRAILPGSLLTLAAIYAVGLIAADMLREVESPDVVAFAITFDLTIVVPLLYYFFMVRGRRIPLVTVAPIFLLSLAGAGLVLPSEHEGFLAWVRLLAIPIELLLLGFIGTKAYRMAANLRHQAGTGARTSDPGDLYDRLRAAAREALGSRFAGDVVATEGSIIYYATAGWRHPTPSGYGLFTGHQRSAYGAVVCALAGVMIVETVALHVVLRQWYSTAAWILTALSIYSLVWIVADFHAIRLRPCKLGSDRLDIRVGMRWHVAIPFENLVGLYRVAKTGTTPPGEPGYLKAVPMGDPGFCVVLRDPEEAAGPYGIKKRVTKVGFTVDAPDVFEALFREHYGAWRARNSDG